MEQGSMTTNNQYNCTR